MHRHGAALQGIAQFSAACQPACKPAGKALAMLSIQIHQQSISKVDGERFSN
jgi:hypothetical protein